MNRFILLAVFLFLNCHALLAEEAHTYVVRGTIVKLPEEGKREVMIKHEPIPDYVDVTGEKVGMQAMTMPFYIDESVTLSDLKVGDRVEFTYLSRWKPKAEDKVTSIKKIEGEVVADATDGDEHAGHVH